MVNQAKEPKPEPKVVKATQGDFLRMFYLLLKQNKITPDNPMEIDVRAFKTIPPAAKMCGKIEDGILSIWLPETRQQKRKREREESKSKLMLPAGNKLILPNRKEVYRGKKG